MKIYNGFLRAVELTALAGAWIASVCVIASMFVIVVDVVGRKFIHVGLPWSQEVSQHLLVIMTFLGLGFALQQGAHVQVEVVTQRLSGRARRAAELIAAVVALCFCVLVTYLVARRTIMAYDGGYTYTGVLHTPLYIIQIFMPIGFGLFTMTFVVDMLKTLRALCSGGGASSVSEGRKK